MFGSCVRTHGCDDERRYGFIKGVDGLDYFIHSDNAVDFASGPLNPGQLVQFTTRRTRRGAQAVGVQRTAR